MDSTVMISGLELASWWGRRPHAHAASSRDELVGLLQLCRDTTACLARAELLAPRSITLSEWVTPGGESIDHPATVLHGDLDDLEARVLAEVERDPRGAVPTEIVIGGTTRIVEASGVDWILDNIVTVTGTQSDHHLVNIALFGDAFLPSDLLGAPQPERHALNAPRLQRALAEIAEAVSPLSPTSTKRAEARGFEVHNLTSNGHVVPLAPSALRRDGEASSLFVTDQVILGPRLRTGSGDEVRAGYLARAPETAVLVTLTTRHAMPPERLREELAFEAEGFATLAWLGDAPEDGIPYEDVLVEMLPHGARVPPAPLPPAQAIAIGVACAEAIERAGRWVGGICPETIYVDADGRFAALAPRGPRFIATAPQRMRGLRSYPVPYEGHEVLALGHPPTRASDVFSLCATLHALVTGKHPFGANLGEIVPRVIAGAGDRLPGPLGDVLARGLVSDPARRPTAAQLAAQLRALA